MSDYTEGKDVPPDASPEELETMLEDALENAEACARMAREWLMERQYPYVRRDVSDVVGYGQRAAALFERFVACLVTDLEADRQPAETE